MDPEIFDTLHNLIRDTICQLNTVRLCAFVPTDTKLAVILRYLATAMF